jgi:glucosyl-dolichyl phosphate glucuronosyltransferase
MKHEPDMTVIIATHNRAAMLRETLKHMARLDHEGIDVEFLVVDNNSTDDTKAVVEDCAGEMAVRYMFESKPGQNCARNRALADGRLGRIVAFSDDDIRPGKDWFRIVLGACERWPQYDVFGGRIVPLWPESGRPGWTDIRAVQELGFAYHEYSQDERLYEDGKYPSSGNLWFRGTVFADGTRFAESVAWHPRNRIMATETIFLKGLAEKGYKMVHCPDSVVGHVITADQMSLSCLLKRAYSWGRGTAHVRGLCRRETLDSHPVWWYFLRYAAVGRMTMELAASMSSLVFGEPRWAMYAMQWLGFNREQIRLAADPEHRG